MKDVAVVFFGKSISVRLDEQYLKHKYGIVSRAFKYVKTDDGW